MPTRTLSMSNDRTTAAGRARVRARVAACLLAEAGDTIIEVTVAALLVAERDRGQSAGPEADLRCLDVADQGVAAVAADFFLVDQFDRRAGRETIQIVSIGERIL